jgi:subtilase family serine protease
VIRMDCWKEPRLVITRPVSTLIVAIVVMAVFVASSASPSLAAQPSGIPGSRYLIPGLLIPALKHNAPLHATPHAAQQNMQLDLSIALKLRHPAELDALIAAQNDPHSSLYHRYITPPEFTALFAPDQAMVDAVAAYLRNQNIRVRSVSSNKLLIRASGSISNIEHAFNTTLADYVVAGQTVYAPATTPSVPATLSGMILNISGLDNVQHYHRLGKLAVKKEKQVDQYHGPGGGYTPDAMHAAYNARPLLTSGVNGSGQTIALFELDGYNPADIQAYSNYYHLGSPQYSDVLVGPATNTAGSSAAEVELDMEQIAAIAPGAQQKVYIGMNRISDVNDMYNRIVNDDSAKIVSISWGLCESSIGNAELQTLNNIFKQGVAQGQAFFAASGDSGAYDCGTPALAVDSPADDPNVVAVGGTTLQIGSDGNYLSETAWSCAFCTQRSQQGAGSGGGVSDYFARSPYQSGPGLNNAHRMVPDVSANADPVTGYSVYCSIAAAGCPDSGWVTVGGTSAATPLWAALAALMNQYLTNAHKPTLGSAGAVLYRLYNTAQTYAPYHDVTTGKNLYYEAATGYDLATGMGTPDAWNIARDLIASSGRDAQGSK